MALGAQYVVIDDIIYVMTPCSIYSCLDHKGNCVDIIHISILVVH